MSVGAKLSFGVIDTVEDSLENGRIFRSAINMEENDVRRAYMHAAEFWSKRVEMMQVWRGKVGRTYPVSEGIMGAAFKSRCIWRTKRFQTLEELRLRLAEDIAKTKDGRDPATVEVSFLAVPFLGPQDQPVLILYADCKELNFFADDKGPT
jgi:hypothetical protein